MVTGYAKSQIALHWSIAALVVVQYALHEPMAEAFDRVIDGGAATVSAGVGLHIFGGFLIFALTLIRLQLRLTRGTPPAPEAEPAPLRTLSRLAHWAFYVLLVLLPVSGAVAWFRQSEAAGDAHEVFRALLLGLIVLHLAGVAVHQLVWKTGLMQRMIRPDAQ